MTFCPDCTLDLQELEEKRKERSQVAYQRKKQLTRLRVKAEKAVEEKLGAQLDVLAPVKYWALWGWVAVSMRVEQIEPSIVCSAILLFLEPIVLYFISATFLLRINLLFFGSLLQFVWSLYNGMNDVSSVPVIYILSRMSRGLNIHLALIIVSKNWNMLSWVRKVQSSSIANGILHFCFTLLDWTYFVTSKEHCVPSKTKGRS